MHILIIPSWYPHTESDVSGIFFREQSIELHKSGQKVGIIYPQLRRLREWKSIVTGPYGFEEASDNGIPTLRFHEMAWLPWIADGKANLFVRRGLQLYQDYVARYGQPDIVHAHAMFNAGMVAEAIKARFGIPYIITEHSSIFVSEQLRPRQMGLARKIATNAERRFAVSPYLSAKLKHILGMPALEWEVMPNIVDRRFFEKTLNQSRPDSSGFVFLHISLFTLNKSINHLIAAFAQAFNKDRSVILQLGGEGKQEGRLKSLARELGVADRVHFLGKLSRDQVIDHMAKADAFVLSSQHETFSVVVIEALALGTPVIATRCGGPESIIRDEDGLLVPTGDIPKLAEAMVRLKENRPQYSAPAIREACRTRYGHAAVVNELTRVYAEIVDGFRLPPQPLK